MTLLDGDRVALARAVEVLARVGIAMVVDQPVPPAGHEPTEASVGGAPETGVGDGESGGCGPHDPAGYAASVGGQDLSAHLAITEPRRDAGRPTGRAVRIGPLLQRHVAVRGASSHPGLPIVAVVLAVDDAEPGPLLVALVIKGDSGHRFDASPVFADPLVAGLAAGRDRHASDRLTVRSDTPTADATSMAVAVGFTTRKSAIAVAVSCVRAGRVSLVPFSRLATSVGGAGVSISRDASRASAARRRSIA